MLKIWDAVNFRRTVGGLSMIAAPLLFAAGEITFPGSGGGPVDLLDASAQHRTLVLVDTYLGIAAAALFVVAFFTLLNVIRTRGVVLTHVGVILGLVGILLAHVGKSVLTLVVWTMASPGVDRGAMVAFLNGGAQNAALAPLFVGDTIFGAALVVIGLAVWRSGYAYRWTGPAIALGLITDIVLSMSPLPDVVASIVSDTLLVIGFASIGYRVLTTPDTDWAQPAAVDRPAGYAPGVAVQA